MELSKAAQQEVIKQATETLSTVKEQCPEVKDWADIFEVAFQSIVELGKTEAIQLFATMCFCALDFEAFHQLQDTVNGRSKIGPMLNTVVYDNCNKLGKPHPDE